MEKRKECDLYEQTPYAHVTNGKSINITFMFGLFKKKDPTAKMEKEYDAMLLEARDIQRSGDIKAYAAKMAEAEELWAKIEKMRADAK